MALLPVSGRNPVLFWLLCALAADCLQRKLSGKLEQRIGQHGLERQTRLRGDAAVKCLDRWVEDDGKAGPGKLLLLKVFHFMLRAGPA